MSIEELLQREETAWARLADTLASVRPERREVEGVVPGLLGRRRRVALRVRGRRCGRSPRTDPRRRAGPSGLGRSRRGDLSPGRAMAWDDMLRHAELSRERVRAVLSTFADPPPKALELFKDETFDHYDEHEAQIRAFSA